MAGCPHSEWPNVWPSRARTPLGQHQQRGTAASPASSATKLATCWLGRMRPARWIQPSSRLAGSQRFPGSMDAGRTRGVFPPPRPDGRDGSFDRIRGHSGSHHAGGASKKIRARRPGRVAQPCAGSGIQEYPTRTSLLASPPRLPRPLAASRKLGEQVQNIEDCRRQGRWIYRIKTRPPFRGDRVRGAEAGPLYPLTRSSPL